MAVFRWGQTWGTLHDLEREVDRLLRSVNSTFQGLRYGRPFPALNLYELPNKYLLIAELPGVRTEEFELTLSGGVLTLSGQRQSPQDVAEERFRRNERFRGQWHRTLVLPERVRQEELSAEFNHGLLKVHLPKAADTPPRQIEVIEGAE